GVVPVGDDRVDHRVHGAEQGQVRLDDVPCRGLARADRAGEGGGRGGRGTGHGETVLAGNLRPLPRLLRDLGHLVSPWQHQMSKILKPTCAPPRCRTAWCWPGRARSAAVSTWATVEVALRPGSAA